MESVIARETEIRRLIPPVRTESLHLAPYFRLAKTPAELEADGLPLYTDRLIPKEIREQMWKDVTADENGMFTFPSKHLILGHTRENVHIPGNEQWRMSPYFIDEQTGRMLPLLTNMTAPTLKRGSQGPQTYEIRNESAQDITMDISRLVCLTDVVLLDGNVGLQQQASGKFATQHVGTISLGADDYEVEIIRRKLAESGRA